MNSPSLYLNGDATALVAVFRQCFAPSRADGFYCSLWQLCILQKVDLYPPPSSKVLLLTG